MFDFLKKKKPDPTQDEAPKDEIKQVHVKDDNRDYSFDTVTAKIAAERLVKAGTPNEVENTLNALERLNESRKKHQKTFDRKLFR